MGHVRAWIELADERDSYLYRSVRVSAKGFTRCRVEKQSFTVRGVEPVLSRVSRG